MNNEKLSHLSTHKYIVLETFRKNGKAVRTPVWFIQSEGSIYIRTDEKSGKVKRLRNNPRVRIVLCNFLGRPSGEWIHGILVPASSSKSQLADRLLDKKYGFQGKLVKILYKIKRISYVIICFKPDTDK
jgi:uncharacterized protein